MSPTVVVATALASALAAATSTVLQHRGARTTAPSEAAESSFISRLLVRPIWLAGLVAAGAGLVLHALALSQGALVVVQPLLVCGVVFALPLSVAIEGHRPSVVEAGWAVVLVGGLSLFLLTGNAHGGQVTVDADTLALLTAVSALTAGGLALLAARLPPKQKALVLAIAAGVGYGVVAALLKQVSVLAKHGWASEFTDWPIYALVVVGLGALWLTQHAYHAGPLAFSMPALTITDPAVSVLVGALAFHEQLADEPLAVAGQVAGFLIMLVATTVLSLQADKQSSTRAKTPEALQKVAT